MALPDVLASILSAHGPSGYETAPAAIWREAAQGFATVAVDHMGSSTATVPGTAGGPSVAIVGHIDEIGLIVNHIDDEGFLWISGVGGWDPIVLVGQRVTLTTRDGAIPGVVAKKPIHLMSPEDRKKVPEMKELHIDIGAKDGDEARGLVRVGDTAVITGDPVELPNGRAFSRAMDNRLGAFVAFEAARLVAEAGGGKGDVVAVAAVQEEIGLNGARTAAFGLQPDAAVVVDVTFATDQPGIAVKELGKHELGSGPVLQRGSTLHPVLFEGLHATAEAQEIPFTVQASTARTGTDADVVHITRAGIPTTVVSVPLRYMHSPVEVCDLADVANAAKLIAQWCLGLQAGQSFDR